MLDLFADSHSPGDVELLPWMQMKGNGKNC